MPIGLLLLVLFITVPLAEIAAFIQVGGLIGLWPTLLLILATAIAGSALVRSQGLGLIAKARAEMDRGRPPVRELFGALCLLIAGLLLLTPGFITDAVGFALLLPPVRDALQRRLARQIEARALHGQPGPGGASAGGRRAPEQEGVIEGDFVELDPADMPPPRGGWDKR